MIVRQTGPKLGVLPLSFNGNMSVILYRELVSQSPGISEILSPLGGLLAYVFHARQLMD